MCKFKLLDTFFNINIVLEYPDLRNIYYSCREHLIAEYKKNEELYIFKLEEKDCLLINKKKPIEVVDLLMTEIGNAIYPIYFNVSQNGELLKVRNFENAKNRWIQKTNELSLKYPVLPFNRYVEIASRNLKNEPKFREAMTRNSFIKLLIKPLDAVDFTFGFNDFPTKGENILFYCKRKRGIKKSGIVTEYKATLIHPSEFNGQGFIKYYFSEFNDIEKIEAQFHFIDSEEKKFTKTINIDSVKEDKNITENKKSFWSNLLN